MSCNRILALTRFVVKAVVSISLSAEVSGVVLLATFASSGMTDYGN